MAEIITPPPPEPTAEMDAWSAEATCSLCGAHSRFFAGDIHQYAGISQTSWSTSSCPGCKAVVKLKADDVPSWLKDVLDRRHRLLLQAEMRAYNESTKPHGQTVIDAAAKRAVDQFKRDGGKIQILPPPPAHWAESPWPYFGILCFGLGGFTMWLGTFRGWW